MTSCSPMHPDVLLELVSLRHSPSNLAGAATRATSMILVREAPPLTPAYLMALSGRCVD